MDNLVIEGDSSSEALPVTISHRKQLNPQQLWALRLLLEGRSASEVARIIGVRRETVSRWKSNAIFQTALEDYMTGIRTQLLSELHRLVPDCVSKIRSVLGSNLGAPYADRSPVQARLALETLRLVATLTQSRLT